MSVNNDLPPTIYQPLEDLKDPQVNIAVPAGEEREYVFSYLTDGDATLDLHLSLAEGARAQVHGVIYVATGGSVTVHTHSQHAAPGTEAHVYVKTVVLGDSSFDFTGMIKIDPEAQQTDSYLENHILLLDDGAKATTVPSLEIEADDVKASHGATVGQIDQEQVFYLMSRGIPRDEAEKLITLGFLEDVVDRITDQEVREDLRYRVARRFGEHVLGESPVL